MSSDSLSQDEIDLLFQTAGETESQAPRERAEPSHDVQVYDFRRPARISKDRKRSLFAIYGLLTKSIEGWLAGRARDTVMMELQSVEQLTFGEFMLALPSPCASYVFEVGEPGGPQGVIDFGHEFAYFLVDRLLGGSAGLTVPDRGLTPLERMVVRIVADRVTSQLSEAWRDYVKMDLAISGFESIPEMLQAANREDPVLVANVRVSMGDTSSLLLLCLPFAVLERFFTGSSNRRVQQAAGTPEEREEDRRRLEHSLREAGAGIQARLPSFRVTMEQLSKLEPGSILPTGLDLDSTLEIHISGQPRFVGMPGRMGRRMAARIIEPVAGPRTH
jgi:flagellar motor switch protein FliM